MRLLSLTVLGLAAIAVLLAGYVWLFLRSHNRLRLPDVRKYLEVLLERGGGGGFLIIRDPGSERFIQFKKYVGPTEGNGGGGIIAHFPKTSWSNRYYEPLKAFLHRENVPFSILPVDTLPTTEFLEIDFGTDIDKATRIVEGIFREVFLMPGELRFRIRGDGISPVPITPSRRTS